ncbi:hypothetical protein CONCODRAFT_12028 [Conidiobolus coronatus NRRL 28638]|uniref:Roadblock/LAMTOR2 domain-containing protein n=1 Tax=Conidiobolus coronatus (strain ATCC 28846 / CBS 209.66 / NRRL 28638) TaxID=796925 RepID=A0A137NTR8_CONC2|nr:hypothetical protein CONCODRAFT_12028 [Conidiobolus coronatus NRRL 28638]|eukprot:KXN66183.1 hypothetical protein CONCODRAFT_12028 [Conidiobolus coronatus NRRL 28638]
MNQISEIEATFQRLSTRSGVKACIVTTLDGSIIKSSLSEADIKQFVSSVPQLVDQAKKVVASWDKNDFIKFFSLRSNLYEFLVYPSDQYLLIVIQNNKN